MAKDKKVKDEVQDEVQEAQETPETPEAPTEAQENTSVTVTVLDAYIGDKGPGEEVELPEKSAKYFASIGYVEYKKKAEDKE